MTTKYVEAGETMDYANSSGSTITAGTPVVVGEQIGIVLEDIADGATGVLAMSGVFNVPKVDAAVIAQGDSVIWDASAGKFDDNAATPATGDVSGCCIAWEAKGATTGEEIAVKLNVGKGTVA